MRNMLQLNRNSHKQVLWIQIILMLGICTTACFANDPRIVHFSPGLDANTNHIADRVEKQISKLSSNKTTATAQQIEVIVALDHAPGLREKTIISKLNGHVVRKWDNLVYALSAKIPVTAVRSLAKIPGVILVDENTRCKKTLYYSTRQTRVRTVWASGYEGNPNDTIAVIDTGIDDSHPDLAGRIAAWADFAGKDIGKEADKYTTPTDKGEHGTHVSGIIGGTGTAAGTTSGAGNILITQTGYFNPLTGYGQAHYFPIDTSKATDLSQINVKMKWTYTDGPLDFVELRICNSSQPLNYGKYQMADPQPASLNYDSVPANTVTSGWFALPSNSMAFNNTAYALQSSVPLSAVGDGKPLMRGMAPGCKIAGVKILDDKGIGTVQSLLDGLNWVSANRDKYHIIAVNMSLDFSVVSPEIDTAVNNLVLQGIVCVCAAGNNRGQDQPNVGSPGSASKCITVAAVNDLDAITDYSCYGTDAIPKPDVAAPGGSFVTHRQILSVDSNDVDSVYNQQDGSENAYDDQYPNDYQVMQGTSMSAPHVAGLVGLISDALGSWEYSETNALRIKAIICMTSTETNKAAEATPNPVLQRGGKDNSEGYGRINADAAVEAVKLSYIPGDQVTGTLGSNPFDKKAWARSVKLTVNTVYSFSLSNPAGADYDLYLYKDGYTAITGSEGEPVIAAESCTAATGGSETIQLTPQISGNYILVIKQVNGSGQFNLSSTSLALSTSFKSPDGYLQKGWNLISLPADPVNPDPVSIFSGFNLDNISLQYWKSKSNSGGWQSYGSSFNWTGPLERGTPYWFLLESNSVAIQYDGTVPGTDFQLDIPAHTSYPYWIMFGTPFPSEMPAVNLRFKNITVDSQEKSWDEAYNLKIVESMASGFNASTGSFFSLGLSSSFPDKTVLQPWYGYWLLVDRPEPLSIHFIKP